MVKIKLCINPNCVACEKKTVYKKENDTFCVKCGGTLVTMCKGCKEVELTETDGDYCSQCQIEQDEKMDKLFANLKKAGAVVVAAGPVIVAVTKVVSLFKKGKKPANKSEKKLYKAEAKLKKAKKKVKKLKDKM